VDRLRRERDVPADGATVALAATDPANPFGWLLPWPSLRGAAPAGDEVRTESSSRSARGARRAAGSAVVLVDGEPVLYLDRNGRRIRTFDAASEEMIERALPALMDVARSRPNRALSIERVDDQSAMSSPLAPLLRAAGFTDDYRYLRLRAR
jgi:ATP-dependent Lhr-like helicase